MDRRLVDGVQPVGEGLGASNQSIASSHMWGAQLVQPEWGAAVPPLGPWQVAPQEPLQGQWAQQTALWVPQSGAEAPAGAAALPPPGAEQDVAGSWGGMRLDPETMAAKLSAAREKNRLAQQRFRERQRAKQQETNEQAEALQREVDEVKSENELLRCQNQIYEKVLAVRDAMLHTLSTLHGPTPQQHGQQLQQQQRSAAQDLVRALEDLPSEGEMDAAEEAAASAAPAPSGVPESTQPPMVQGAGSEAGGGPMQGSLVAPAVQGGLGEQLGSSGSLPSVSQGQQEAPRWTLAEQHRAGATSQLDGSALRRVKSIPPPSDEVVRAKVMAMTEPDHLLDYYRQWQAELAASYCAAEASGFDGASVAELEGLQERMATVWWHVGHLRPDYLCYLAAAALPEDSGQFPLWREVAERVLPELDENSRGLLRRAWYGYSKEMAKISVKVSRWVQKLQAYTVRPLEAMSTTAGNSMQLVEITTNLFAAVQDEYNASMEFIGEQSRATTALQKAFINKESAPFMPDLVAIVYQLLRLDGEQREAGRAPGAAPTVPLVVLPPRLPQLPSGMHLGR